MSAPAIRRRLLCRGTVQGVGFRPAVYRLATALELGGWVLNDPQGVTIEVEGPAVAVARFIDELPAALPSLAHLESCVVAEIEPIGEAAFTVQASRAGDRARGSLPADTALCEACRTDMERPGDRRFHYPFTTCSNCGPRFSIVYKLPYDRTRTSMACFPLCPDCAREYTAPRDRRFHAEPLGCPACGPRLWLAGERASPAEGSEALARVRAALAEGSIVALKGLGGFQLACRADREDAVARLRERKQRPCKPLAIMARDLAAARRVVHLTPADEALLVSAPAPILLATRRAAGPIAPSVAPGLADLGVMVPTTPLHIELFRGAGYDYLVMTSGNLSDEPIACGNREALARLRGIADLFLLHDRDVVRRLDDSVARTADRGPFLVRRSRGYVPRPLPLPAATPRALLALGGHLQATACLALGDEAVLSQHVGDLDNDEARRFLREAAEGIGELLQARPEALVVDPHPDYPSTWVGEAWAGEAGIPLLRAQHHLAHAAAVLAEHGAFPRLGERAAALVLDGTGWGPDGTAWGGECLVVEGDLAWRRAGHLAPFPLVGGEQAVREPWRVAVALLAQADGADPDAIGRLVADLPLGQLVTREQVRNVARLSRQGHWPLATGAGRLCEAAGALLGLTAVNRYEGEAAALCEAAALPGASAPCGPVLPIPRGPRDPRQQLPAARLLAAVAAHWRATRSAGACAAAFHATLSRMLVELAVATLPPDVTGVALGGGCFVNRLLREGVAHGLEAAGYTVWLPQAVPPGDGGLAYGQAALAAMSLAREVEPRLEGSEPCALPFPCSSSSGVGTKGPWS